MTDERGAADRRRPAGSLEALLQRAAEEAARLLLADGAMIYLVDPETGRLRFAHDAGITDARVRRILRRLRLTLDTGMFGRAIGSRSVVSTGDYQTDRSFQHAEPVDRASRALEIRSMVVAPLVVGDEAIGGLGVYAKRPDAFDEADVALVRSLAEHAAGAIANARLIEALDRSQDANRRRADVERALREIAGRISAIRDPAELLQQVVDEAAGLLGADGARIDLLDEADGGLYWAYDARTGLGPPLGPIAGEEEVGPGQGISGRAVAENEPFYTGDYLADDRFEHAPAPDAHVTRYGIRSVLSAPLAGDAGPLGALTVYTSQVHAYGPEDARLIEALANQAGVAIRNARLIEALDRSRAELARRADAERALREIGARISAMRDQAEILEDVVTEAARLLGGDGALINLVGVRGHEHLWSHEAAAGDASAFRELATVGLVPGVGVSGLAVTERAVVRTGDYVDDERFAHTPERDRFVERAGVCSVIAAPMFREDEAVGAITIYATRRNAFDDADGGVLAGLATLASVAITNARLIGELERSREELARAVETERTLHDIAGRITALREPGSVLADIVEEARRLLASDGAHLTRMTDDGRSVVPVYVAGGMDEATREWLRDQEYPLDAGINGLAASRKEVVWTRDYTADERIPRMPDDLEVAARLGLRAMAAAPLRTTGGEVLGTLAVSYRQPRDIPPDRLALLQGLADHAAIAVANSALYERLADSEARFKFLVDHAPDIVFSTDARGRFTYVGESIERLLGWRPDQLAGRSFLEFVDPASHPVALDRWENAKRDPEYDQNAVVDLLASDGRRLPFEINAVAISDAGRFGGIHGSARDVTERTRLERELRDSEARFRFLVQASPDIIFSADPDGRFTYMSESVGRVLGYAPTEFMGQHFGETIDESTIDVALRAWDAMRADLASPQTFRLLLIRKDGRRLPMEVHAAPIVVDGAFAGVHGSTRDLSERERLEARVRESEARYRQLVQSSPDVIWQNDADGRFVFVSDTAEQLFGRPAADLVGRHFSEVVAPGSMADAEASWARLSSGADESVRFRYVLRHRDGSEFPTEVSAVPIIVDGRFAGAHGSIRDLLERERLEAELRQRAAELAATDERARLARELHDSVTQALFSMTLVTRTIELLLERDPAAVPGQLAMLRDLQRDALAEMRSLIFELRPGSLRKDGLAQAIRTHAAAVEGRVGLAVRFEFDDIEPLADDVEDALFRIAQEGLHNVVKHARASEARVTLRREGDRIRLVVEDDGVGFDPDGVPAGHLGLTGIRSRCERLGGELAITARAGGGTRLEVTVPIAAAVPMAT